MLLKKREPGMSRNKQKKSGKLFPDAIKFFRNDILP